ncbi:branched-chain amino acid transport system ATP-binding protein [Agromyces cerinus]|uniref:ABC transporter ATP-binding protein n=1 Tax=Agromyces cerinus TaxID=33878 RepID=UPI00195DF57D|nr:ABC transporter ATP-binding protein [Agromyces cerinus]MBM7830218.1 branched-chain amino acid transport system ATP-binding protein [Agromyces cerinus]
MTTTLEVRDADVVYGRVHALRELSFTVGEGEIVCLLGNNGAGKSTTMNMLSGLVRPRSGSVSWQGMDLTMARPWDIVSAGLIHVPEGRRIFSTMTVHENLLLGGYTVRDQKAIASRLDEVYGMMPRLAERRAQQGGTLSGGEQQMVAIGRALIGGPKLLLLDEPSMGLAPLVVKQVMEIIAAVNAAGTTVLLVEQNARAALKIAHRAYVVETGSATLEGPAAELAKDPRVIEAYLGG